ncbi:ABC transporter permease [Clostridium cylindrosporum]|uniref:Ferric transport system permease protein FbpB n=1 Tax=Clostridium cylindrosporum DSM 605 TaxID=1121307 RepID=A0A0J8D9B9_CLOCY|nr:iron ABC transporter permease [Clostridium cylindrosporum]KMT22452.1 ferric transport system permease protein FbpB [Clostridium cylindrosporum DSM 605]
MKSKFKKVSKLDTSFYNLLDKGLISIVLILCIIFILYPIICLMIQSIKVDTSISFKLYENIIEKNKRLLFNSIFVATLSGAISTILSLIIALRIHSFSSIINKLGKIILMLSMISPPFVASLAYIQLFGRRGYITYHFLGINYDPYGIHGVIIMQVIGFIPLSALMILGVIEKVDKRLLKASLDLGSSENKAIISVLLPLIKPGIIVSFLLTFVRSLADFGTVTIIGGSFETIATEIYMEIIGYANFSNAAAMNFLLVLPAIIIFIPYRRNMRRLNQLSKDNELENNDDFKLLPRGGLKSLLSVFTIGFIAISLLQYGCIFLSSISKFSRGNLIFTTEYIKYIREYSMDSFIRSITYAFIAGIFGSLLGIIISYYIDRRRIIGGRSIDFITTLPYILPGTFFGISYILAFNSFPFPLTGTAFIVVINCIFKQIPLTTKISSAVLSQISIDVEHAARDIGASKFHVIKDIILPNAREAFLIGFVNNFISTMTTIGAIIFLIYPGKEVATVKLFDAINSGEYGVASMIAVIIILITLSINTIFTSFISRKKVG